MAKRTEPLVEFDIKVVEAKSDWLNGSYTVKVYESEARRIASELTDYFAQQLIESPPRYHGFELTDEQWDKLETNVRKARTKKE